MDLILTLPVWRMSVVLIPAAVTAAGTVLLAAAVMLGTRLGLACVRLEEPVAVLGFLPAAANLACMTFCFTAMTTLISAGIRDRWMSFAIGGGFFIVQMVIDLVARMWPEGKWLFKLTFLSAFQPQELVLTAGADSGAGLRLDLTLIGLGLACYTVAIVIFNRRDIPGPR